MTLYSTKEAVKKLGISLTSMNRYIAAKKIPLPPITEEANINARLWTEEDIEKVRVALPKIANGRKTRYQKLKEKQKAQPRAAVPHKSRKPKKK